MASRNTFTDAAMFGSIDDYPNIFTGDDGEPAAGAGDFVLSSPDIQTFSLAGIIILVACTAFLLLTATLISWFIRPPHRSHDGKCIWARYNVLSATQLFRCKFETGLKPEASWDCDEEGPNPMIKSAERPTTVLARCQEKDCLGHIATNIS